MMKIPKRLLANTSQGRAPPLTQSRLVHGLQQLHSALVYSRTLVIRQSAYQQHLESTATMSSGMCACMPSKQLKDEVLEADFNAHIALGCESYFYIDDDGETWWSGVPKNLHNKLWGRQSSLPAVHYVELDACDAQNYFVSFAADDANWAGPKGLTKALQAGYDEGDDPVIVCFAPDDGWFVLWDTGESQWEGIPQKLHNQLNGRQNSLPGVESISCGATDHEWFVRYEDGSWRARFPDTLQERVNRLHSDGYAILGVEFGSSNSWVVSYE